ncbi:MAG: hypothetical protein ACI9OJ_000694 [Myxococcota bacterium]
MKAALAGLGSPWIKDPPKDAEGDVLPEGFHSLSGKIRYLKKPAELYFAGQALAGNESNKQVLLDRAGLDPNILPFSGPDDLLSAPVRGEPLATLTMTPRKNQSSCLATPPLSRYER